MWITVVSLCYMTVLFGDLIQRVFKELFEEKEQVTIAFRIISGKLNLKGMENRYKYHE